MLPEERVSVVETATVQQREKRVEAVIEVPEIKPEQSVKQVVTLPQAEREIEDDWFVLLDAPTREPSFVPPGIVDPLRSPYKLIVSFSA